MSHDLAVLEEVPGAIPGDDIFDITIIGAGPTGQFAAFYAGLRGARTQGIDAPGGAGGSTFRHLSREVHL